MTLNYKTEDGKWFEYEVDNYDVDQKLYEWMYENFNSEELLDYIFDADGCVVDLHKEFKDTITELFEDDAREWYEEMCDE